MKIKKNTPTFLNNDSSKTFLPILSLIIARGWMTSNNSLLRALNKSIILTVFIPPVVDPAHPPINIMRSNTKMDILGHKA